ncbi:hypothetical protein VSR34_39370, partial [Paraburkholderia sp. JHI2823]|uniref:hypothetical protein n=1 Tax=Paraburkholderia sp. JHI2823 TaxID=3112960 RepID=UPI0031787EFB
MTMVISIAIEILRNSFRYRVTAACRVGIASVFSSWLRTGSHQTPIGFKHTVMELTTALAVVAA